MKHSHAIKRRALPGIFAAALPTLANAQQVTYDVLSASAVPTLGDYGLVVLALLIAGAAVYLSRNAQAKVQKLVALLALSACVALVGAKHDLIEQAWAGFLPFNVDATASGVVELGPDQGVYAITNRNGTSIRIKAFVPGVDVCTEVPSHWEILGGIDAQATPGCVIGELVAPDAVCHVLLDCVIEGEV